MPSATASTRTSPTTLISPPTITRSGLTRLQIAPTARPTVRPASANRRRAPASPARASAIASATVTSGPCSGRSAVQQRGGRRHGLQAAAVAAAADPAGRVGDDVAELAGQPGVAEEQLAVEDQPGADAAAEHHVDDVARAAPGAVADLGQRAEVRVVAHQDRPAEAPLQLAAGRERAPAGQDRRRAGVAGLAQDRRADRDADADGPGRGRSPARAELRRPTILAASAIASPARARRRRCRCAPRRSRRPRGRRPRRGRGRGRSRCRPPRPPPG